MDYKTKGNGKTHIYAGKLQTMFVVHKVPIVNYAQTTLPAKAYLGIVQED